jgi:ketosteroid isomerase-like protein
VTDEKRELLRELYTAWQGDDGDTAPCRFLADDFEYVNPPYAVHPGTRQGKAGWSAAARNLSDSFDSWSHQVGEMIDAGDKVLVFATFCARGRGSSVDLEKFEPHLWTFRDGKVIRFEWFSDRTEALRAAGLPQRD